MGSLFSILISGFAAAFLIASPGYGQVQKSDPEGTRQEHSGSENGNQAIVGTWKLIEARAYDDAGHELAPPFGPTPMGIAVFSTERLIVVVADGRTSLPPDAPPRGFVSYTGNYQFDGTKLVTHADGASNPTMLKDQVRSIEFTGKDRYVARPISGLVGQNAGLQFVWERVR